MKSSAYSLYLLCFSGASADAREDESDMAAQALGIRDRRKCGELTGVGSFAIAEPAPRPPEPSLPMSRKAFAAELAALLGSDSPLLDAALVELREAALWTTSSLYGNVTADVGEMRFTLFWAPLPPTEPGDATKADPP